MLLGTRITGTAIAGNCGAAPLVIAPIASPPAGCILLCPLARFFGFGAGPQAVPQPTVALPARTGPLVPLRCPQIPQEVIARAEAMLAAGPALLKETNRTSENV